MLSTLKRLRSGDDTDVIPFKKSRHGIPFGFFRRNDSSLIEKGITYSKLGVVHRIIHSIHHLAETYPGGGTPIHYLYGYVPPDGVVILKLLI